MPQVLRGAGADPPATRDADFGDVARPVAGGRLSVRPAESTSDQGPSGSRPLAAPVVLAATLTALLGLWAVDRPSPWRDELVTLAVSQRSAGEIVRLAGYVDGALTPYYLAVHALPGGLTGIRLVSVVALAGTAASLVWFGRLAGAPAAGCWGAAVVGILPTASRYAQEARPYALSVLLASLATCLLLRALHGRAWRVWIPYLVAVVTLGHVQLVGMLILSAHGTTVLLLRRGSLRCWTGIATGACALVVPLGLIAFSQRHAVAWLPTPEQERLLALPTFLAGLSTPVVMLLVGVLGGIVVAALDRPAEPPRPAGLTTVLAVAVPWALLPPVLLFVGGQLTPLYNERYLVFCLPAVALLAGAVLAGLRQPVIARGCVLALLLVALPQHVQIRAGDGHGEDVTVVLRILVTHARPDDAVLFDPNGTAVLAEAYPRTFAPLDPIGQQRTGAAAGKLAAEWADAPTVLSRLQFHDRVWQVGITGARTDPAAAAARPVLRREFTRVRAWSDGVFAVSLHERHRHRRFPPPF